MTDDVEFLSDLADRVERIGKERITGDLNTPPDSDRIREIATKLAAARGRLWSAYPRAGYARSELRLLFELHRRRRGYWTYTRKRRGMQGVLT